MPEPSGLRLLISDGQCLVSFGRVRVYCYDVDDIGMRNLAIVALTDAKQPNKDVAVFGLAPTYVSILRSRARAQFGWVGAPPWPTAQAVRSAGHAARQWALAGCAQQAIADEFGLGRPVCSAGLLVGSVTGNGGVRERAGHPGSTTRRSRGGRRVRYRAAPVR